MHNFSFSRGKKGINLSKERADLITLKRGEAESYLRHFGQFRSLQTTS